jgi:hypothetical protein
MVERETFISIKLHAYRLEDENGYYNPENGTEKEYTKLSSILNGDVDVNEAGTKIAIQEYPVSDGYTGHWAELS